MEAAGSSGARRIWLACYRTLSPSRSMDWTSMNNTLSAACATYHHWEERACATEGRSMANIQARIPVFIQSPQAPAAALCQRFRGLQPDLIDPAILATSAHRLPTRLFLPRPKEERPFDKLGANAIRVGMTSAPITIALKRLP